MNASNAVPARGRMRRGAAAPVAGVVPSASIRERVLAEAAVLRAAPGGC